MAKVSGIGGNFYVNGYDLSGDVSAINNVTDSGALLDVTAIDKGAHERIPGLADGQLAITSFFNSAAAAQHAVLSVRGTTDQIATYASGITIGSPGWSVVGKQTDYSGTRGADGSLAFSVGYSSSNGDGTRGGEMLTAGIRTDTAASNGTSLDGVASSSFGAVLFLHVFAGTIDVDATIKLQDSANDSSWSDVTGGAFAALSGSTTFPYAERIELASDATVRRYLRVITATTAGFTTVSFAVLACRRFAAF